MDALLQELEQVDAKPPPTRVPHKKGSFVEPGQEHTTTNLFVGNLAPTLTEEEVTDLFRQFGRLAFNPLGCTLIRSPSYIFHISPCH